MRGRVIILLGAIILLALVVVVVLMQDSGGDTTADSTPGAGDLTGEPVVGERTGDGGAFPQGSVGTLVEIVVAYQNITRGMVIPEDGVGLQLWPQDALPEEGNYYRADQMTDVIGRFARTDIPRGAPILARQLVDSPADLAAVGSDAAAFLNREPPGTVAVSIPLDPSGIGQVAYGIKDGDRVDIILSFLFVDVDPAFQTRMPNNYSVITRLETGELSIGAPRQGRVEPSTLSPEGVLLGPSEASQRPRLVTQRTVTDALVVHVGFFDEDGKLFGKTPTPLEVATLPPPPGEETQQQQEVTPPPTATPYTPVIITLGVTPQDALVLTWAVDAQIPITLALRQAGDRTVTETQPVTLDYMIRNYGVEPPTTLEFSLEPPITSVRRFDIGTLYDFLADSLNE